MLLGTPSLNCTSLLVAPYIKVDGVVLHAVTELLPLEASLRGAWCKEKFGFNAQGAREGRDVSGSSKRLDLDVVDEAIQRSTRFWAYVHMIKHIGETIEHIMFWCESCPCHGHDAALQGKLKHRQPGLQSRIGMASCPLQARRAPECAAGRLLEIAREGFQASQREVLLSPSLASCSEEDQAVVVGDFNHARRYSMLVCTLKFSFWEQIPGCSWELPIRIVERLGLALPAHCTCKMLLRASMNSQGCCAVQDRKGIER